MEVCTPMDGQNSLLLSVNIEEHSVNGYSTESDLVIWHRTSNDNDYVLMQFFCCYTLRSEDLLKLLTGTKSILSKDQNIISGNNINS